MALRPSVWPMRHAYFFSIIIFMFGSIKRHMAYAAAFIMVLLHCNPVLWAGNNWALVRVSVANVREKPGHAAELGSQVIMGTPLKVTGSEGDWLRIETPEGYKGYIIKNSVRLKSDEEMARWRTAARVAVNSFDQTYIYDSEAVSGDGPCDMLAMHRVTDVVNGSILETGAQSPEGFCAVRLPDGREGYIRSGDVAPLQQLGAAQVNMDDVIGFAIRLNGTPYLWGGTSSKSMDCSGLTKIAFLSQGVILPRNASQQAKIGAPVSAASGYRKGDLLFFGNPATGRVNHVGMYIGDHRFVHCAGRVMVSSLEPSDKDYIDLYLLGVRRLSEEDFRQMSVNSHSWYF